MSYSSGTSQDSSIKALLRRLDAVDPLGDECIRSDPMQVLREARMKVAAQASRNDEERETSDIEDGELVGEFVGVAPWHEMSSIDVSSSSAVNDINSEREPSKGELVVVEAVTDQVVRSRRWPLIAAGLAIVVVCAGATFVYEPTLISGLEQAGIELSSIMSNPAVSEAPPMKAASVQDPVVEGVGRFTIAAFSLVGANAANMSAEPRAENANSEMTVLAQRDETAIAADAGDEVRLPIELSPAHGTGEVAAIVLRGLPPDYNVAGAMPSGDNSWVLSPDSLDGARIIVPPGGAGDVTVTAELFDMSAQPIGSPRFILKVKPTEVTRSLDPQRAQALLARGRGLLQAGDISGARLLFEMAAESGVAEGAYALGETFDPLQLAARGAVGLTGDAARARFWYAQASENGVVAARERLATLEATN